MGSQNSQGSSLKKVLVVDEYSAVDSHIPVSSGKGKLTRVLGRVRWNSGTGTISELVVRKISPDSDAGC